MFICKGNIEEIALWKHKSGSFSQFLTLIQQLWRSIYGIKNKKQFSVHANKEEPMVGKKKKDTYFFPQLSLLFSW